MPAYAAVASLACRPNLAEKRLPWVVLTHAPRVSAHTLLSFERPAAPAPPGVCAVCASSPVLENCTVGQNIGCGSSLELDPSDHRQDVKGTRWMPWHQESMKDVDGCDKPR